MLKLDNLQLGQKFILLLLLVFLGGIIASSVALSSVLNQNAQVQLTTKALMLMETMNSVRDYTTNQVNPELANRLTVEFLPETVPAYAAREVFESFRGNPIYADFFLQRSHPQPHQLTR